MPAHLHCRDANAPLLFYATFVFSAAAVFVVAATAAADDVVLVAAIAIPITIGVVIDLLLLSLSLLFLMLWLRLLGSSGKRGEQDVKDLLQCAKRALDIRPHTLREHAVRLEPSTEP